MKEITFKITGTSPLLMHCDRLANPLDPLTIAHKKLTQKKNKTEDDLLEIARSDWMGGLYCDERGPYLPTPNLRKALVDGATQSKRGPAVKGGTMIIAARAHLTYSGPRDPEALWLIPEFVDARGVVNSGKARVIRYRPRFLEWGVLFTLAYDPSKVEAELLLHDMSNAGRYVGIGDYRPAKNGAFGRFEVEAV